MDRLWAGFVTSFFSPFEEGILAGGGWSLCVGSDCAEAAFPAGTCVTGPFGTTFSFVPIAFLVSAPSLSPPLKTLVGDLSELTGVGEMTLV